MHCSNHCGSATSTGQQGAAPHAQLLRQN
jgi:hypothetical protein